MKMISDPFVRIRALLIFFMIGLILSGLSAVPLQWEVGILKPLFGSGSQVGRFFPAVSVWMDQVYQGVKNGYGQYPFLAYGTDWLAFGHVSIALAFIGPLREPVRNLWVVEFGMLVCCLLIPWALVFGPLRGIPFFSMLLDMSFGVFGFIPLWLARRTILGLAQEP
jgi:hypothetical protein